MNENKNEKTIIDTEEFAVAENEAKNSTDTYTHKFAKPFSYEGKTYEEMTFDWGNLSGEDSLAIENELQQLGKIVVTPEFSGEYLVRMASRACATKIGSDVICAMPLKDFNKIRAKARSFLMSTAL